MLILAFIVFGMFVGWLAQLILGRSSDQIDWPLTLGAGIGGSLLGGVVSTLLGGDGFGSFHPAGFIGSILGAIVVTIGWQLYKRSERAKR